MPTSFLSLWILILIWVGPSLKIASENQRFIAYRLGRYFGLEGPGLILIIPGIDKRIKMSVGDRGELNGKDLARIKKVDVPVRVDDSVVIGQAVRIQGFTEKDVLAILDPARSVEFVCQKCGHVNRM
jgi:regulator of protease activity HflC (stomatin/prohibitin superfamily)